MENANLAACYLLFYKLICAPAAAAATAATIKYKQ